jgi:hypothetical protein
MYRFHREKKTCFRTVDRPGPFISSRSVRQIHVTRQTTEIDATIGHDQPPSWNGTDKRLKTI